MGKMTNTEFTDILDYLTKEIGYKLKGVANKSTIDYWRLNNIKRGSAKATDWDYQKIIKAYPEVGERFGVQVEELSLERRVQQLEKENAEMKAIIYHKLDEILNNQKQLLSNQKLQEGKPNSSHK